MATGTGPGPCAPVRSRGCREAHLKQAMMSPKVAARLRWHSRSAQKAMATVTEDTAEMKI